MQWNRKPLERWLSTSHLQREPLARKTLPGRVFNQDRYERPDPARVQETVFLLNYVLDVFPGQGRKLRGKPVHHVAQRPQLFAYSHRESVWVPTNRVKT